MVETFVRVQSQSQLQPCHRDCTHAAVRTCGCHLVDECKLQVLALLRHFTCMCLIFSVFVCILRVQGGAQLFWQWMNQSYNAAFNFGNRNATVPVDYRQLALSYGIATGTALSAAWGLGKIVQRAQASLGSAKPTFRFKLLQSGIPWLAVATAGTANALAMRYKEGVYVAVCSVLMRRMLLRDVALLR